MQEDSFGPKPGYTSLYNTREQQHERQREQESEQREHVQVQYRPLFGGTMSCPNCGEEVRATYEICPHCGFPLHTGTCTYCGAPMDADDMFCGECGGSRKGVTCPECGTLNFRSFCRNCNAPLDELAQQEMEKAKNDPIFGRMLTLAKRMAELEEQMEAVAMGTYQPEGEVEEEEEERVADFTQVAELTEEEKALVEQYKQMMEQMGMAVVEPPKPEAPKAEAPKPAAPKKRAKLEAPDLSALQEEYRQGLQEMSDLMSQLIPDPGTTPQIQRNYYSARKLPVFRTEVVHEPAEWVCNFCGCHHRQPSECAEPQLGGTWVYNSYTVTTKTYEYQ